LLICFAEAEITEAIDETTAVMIIGHAIWMARDGHQVRGTDRMNSLKLRPVNGTKARLSNLNTKRFPLKKKQNKTKNCNILSNKTEFSKQ